MLVLCISSGGSGGRSEREEGGELGKGRCREWIDLGRVDVGRG